MGSRALGLTQVNVTTRTMMTCHKKMNMNMNMSNNEKKRNNKIVAVGGAKFRGTWMKEKFLSEMIVKRVEEAQRVCDGNKWSDECKVAWDEVEEISRAKADLRLRLANHQDPLEPFCRDHPEADECRIMIYDDN